LHSDHFGRERKGKQQKKSGGAGAVEQVFFHGMVG
jgi:hypothetical protein